MLAVFLFAHQDDEFGCFGSLERARAQGLRPVCLYLTDGGGGAALPKDRCAESQAVLEQCGVLAADIHFVGCEHGIADGFLSSACAQAFDACEAVLEAYAGQKIAELHIHAWEGGHPDHDAGHLVGLALANRLGCLAQTRQFALYHGAGVRYGLFRVLAPLRENGPVEAFSLSWAVKKMYLKAFSLYPSQVKAWVGLFPFVVLHLLFWGTQQTQAVTLHRRMERPHAGPLLYEERGMSKWDAFVTATASFQANYFSAPADSSSLGSGASVVGAL